MKKTISFPILASLLLFTISPSCTSPTGTGAALGAGVGALGGYLYDRHDKRDDGDPQQWDRERRSNVARGAAIGAGAGAGIGYLSGQSAQRQQQAYPPPNPYSGYPQQPYYPQQGYAPQYR
jgi:hypothetical protein